MAGEVAVDTWGGGGEVNCTLSPHHLDEWRASVSLSLASQRNLLLDHTGLRRTAAGAPREFFSC